jgi:hypothetical protein
MRATRGSGNWASALISWKRLMEDTVEIRKPKAEIRTYSKVENGNGLSEI